MAPKRTPSLAEGVLPDGRTFRLVASGARLFIGTFVGTTREANHQVPMDCDRHAMARKLNIDIEHVPSTLMAAIAEGAGMLCTLLACTCAHFPQTPGFCPSFCSVAASQVNHCPGAGAGSATGDGTMTCTWALQEYLEDIEPVPQ